MAPPESRAAQIARRAGIRARLGPLVLVAAAAWVASGCEPRAPETAPAELRVSAIPDQAPAQVLRQHQTAVDAVCAAAAIRCRWVEVPTYEELVDRLGRREIDLAFLGGVTFVQASERYGVVPLAMRDVDFRFTSVVMVPAGASARRLEDLIGGTFAFGARNSTSGHFMPRHFLQRQGIEPERDFSRVVYSGAHDRTLRMIASGEVSAGAVNSSIAYASIAPGGPMFGKLRVLWQSPPYADYVWVAGRHLPETLRQRLIDAFLDLDGSTDGPRLALEREQARGYVPAYDIDFAAVREVVRAQGALGG